jgi:hypothetical protein
MCSIITESIGTLHNVSRRFTIQKWNSRGIYDEFQAEFSILVKSPNIIDFIFVHFRLEWEELSASPSVPLLASTSASLCCPSARTTSTRLQSSRLSVVPSSSSPVVRRYYYVFCHVIITVFPSGHAAVWNEKRCHVKWFDEMMLKFNGSFWNLRMTILLR